MRYHPERFTNGAASLPPEQAANVARIVDSKARWVQTRKTPENARERHQAITAANEALQPYLSHLRSQVEQARYQIAERKRANAILESREYSFCIYPRQHFEKLLLDDPTLVP
jgi:predicted RNase H-like nuclease (RuvC/YqgF family)